MEGLHLPWSFLPDTACWLCKQKFGGRVPLRAQLQQHSLEERQMGEFASHFTNWANSMISLVEGTRRIVPQHTFEELVMLFKSKKWYPVQTDQTSMARVMLTEVAHMMGQPITPDALQFSPPNHPVSLLNWISISKMLTEQSPEGRELYRECLVPSASSQIPHQVQVAAVDAHCHLHLLKSREMQARRDNPEVWSFPFDFEENSIHAWEAAFASYQRDSGERLTSLSIDLAAVVDNRVFPGDWA